jgi:hypothetical protein
MSLRAQLVRGALALPLLAGFAALAWQAHATQGSVQATATSLRVVAAAHADASACRLAGPGLRLALAPADLPPLRRDAACHAPA